MDMRPELVERENADRDIPNALDDKEWDPAGQINGKRPPPPEEEKEAQ